MHESELTGDQLLQVLSTLANPHRLRVVAALEPGRKYVSELARQLGISRPLLQMHLRKLQAAGLVTAQLELAADGKAVNYYSLTSFAFRLSPDTIARAVGTLTEHHPTASKERRQQP
jgi:DNA-binding transcriptional ArsR family regulator